MLLNKVEFKNYRCFKDYELTLKSGVNVIIGKNGAGKSALMHGIVKLLSFMFSNDRSMGVDFVSAGITSLNVRQFTEAEFYRIPGNRTPSGEVCLAASGEFEDENVDWKFYRRLSGRQTLSSGYKKASKTMIARFNVFKPMPVMAFYSDGFPHTSANLTKVALGAANSDKMPRNFGYYQWDDETACVTLWATRLLLTVNECQLIRNSADSGVDKEVQSAMISRQELFEEESFITRGLSKFSQALSPDMAISHFRLIRKTYKGSKMELAIVFSDGSIRTFDELPAGYKRLFSMALDLLYRCWILNRSMESSGVVLIDELDLHLHPELEQNIANVLSEIFPNIQFIVSTHSPLLIANLPVSERRNQILRMETGQTSPTVLNSIFGIDYDTSVESIMGVEIRSSEVQSMIESFVILQRGGYDEQAQQMKNALVELIGSEQQFENLANQAESRLDL